MEKMNHMKMTALSLILISIIAMGVSACSSEEFEINGQKKTLARRNTSNVGEDTFQDNEVWIADDYTPKDEWKIEICPGCSVTVGYSWTEEEFYPDNKCIIISNAHIDHPWPSALVINHDTIVKNLKSIHEISITENPISWKTRRKYGATIAFNGDVEMLCSYEDTLIVTDSLGKDSVINRGCDRDTIITISNIHAEKDISVSMHLKNY